jgi:PAS domain S-box-containing protein
VDEQTFAASEPDLKLVIDTTPALIWSTLPNGELNSVNQHYLDFVGTAWEALRDWGWAKVVHPDDLERLTEIWRTSLAAGVSGEAEARLRRHDGVYRWFLFRANPLRDEKGTILKWCGINTDIEDRKRAEQALAASERNLRLIIDTIPVMAWCNRTDGSNEFLNQRWHDYTGLPPEEAHGWGWQVTLHPDDLPKLMTKWRHMLATGESGELEARLRRFDGVYRWFLFRCDPLRGESGTILKWYGTNTDIDDLKRVQPELRRSEALLAQGEAVSETGSFLWRAGMDEVLGSEQLYRILGYEPGSGLEFSRTGERIHPDDRGLAAEALRRGSAGLDFEYEPRFLMPDGSTKYLHFVTKPRRDAEGQLEMIGTVQDITRRKLAEREHDRVRSELTHAARAMSLGVLAASLAHEINQPLAGIITNASTSLRMLSADPPNIDGAQETARRTIRDANRASTVVGRLRTLFSKKEFATETVDLTDAAREVLALSAHELQRHHITVRTKFAKNPVEVTGDRVQIQQVILNLLLNASDAVKGIENGARAIVVGTNNGDGSGHLTVHDTGVGIAPQELGKLFDPFYTTKPDGMGIGLSVSRFIIERHKGRLWAIRNEGPGATFAFSIPRLN